MRRPGTVPTATSASMTVAKPAASCSSGVMSLNTPPGLGQSGMSRTSRRMVAAASGAGDMGPRYRVTPVARPARSALAALLPGSGRHRSARGPRRARAVRRGWRRGRSGGLRDTADGAGDQVVVHELGAGGTRVGLVVGEVLDLEQALAGRAGRRTTDVDALGGEPLPDGAVLGLSLLQPHQHR